MVVILRVIIVRVVRKVKLVIVRIVVAIVRIVLIASLPVIIIVRRTVIGRFRGTKQPGVQAWDLGSKGQGFRVKGLGFRL